jgi:3-dehydroquinate synthase
LGTPLFYPRACKLHPVSLSDTFAPGSLQEAVASSKRRPVLCTERRLLKILDPMVQQFRKSFPGMPVLSFQGGERHKTRRAKERLEDSLLALGTDRGSILVALGGGMVTDLVGFTAATFMRGIPWIAVPTTLLGMVDASLGGKTAVDTPGGKNVIGAFHPPVQVCVALDSLGSLPPGQFLCGLAECVKHGLFMEASYFRWLHARKVEPLQRDPGLLHHLVAASVALKCAVVDEDPEERTGRRNILNAGHTVGHALERLSSYRMFHGEAVAAGLLWESAASVADGYLDKADLATVGEAIAGLGFPSAWRSFSHDAVFLAAGADKKNRAGAVAYVPLGSIGRPALPPPHVAELRLASLRAGVRLLGKA